jgi:large-conductance mechanosensitive channel
MKSPEDDVAVAMPGSVAVAVPAGKAMAVPMTQQPKQGGKCCGSCCDYRRAVIIISAISVLFTIISLARGEPEVQVEDDDLAKQFVAIQDDYKTNFLVLNIFSLIMALVSIVGAVQFNQHMIGLNVLYVIIEFILEVVYGSKVVNEVLDAFDESNYGDTDDIFTEEDQDAVERLFRYGMVMSYVILGFITAFWIYPSVMLITEIRSKVMSRETYPREEFSCCCVSR